MAKAFMFWTCACLLSAAPRQPSPINQAWSGVYLQAWGRRWASKLPSQGTDGACCIADSPVFSPSVPEMPCLVAQGSEVSATCLTESSPLFRSQAQKKTHAHQTKALLSNTKYCFLISSVAKRAVRMFRRPFNYFHFKNVYACYFVHVVGEGVIALLARALLPHQWGPQFHVLILRTDTES